MGKDVAAILEYSRTADAIKVHVDKEDKEVSEILTPGGKQQVPIINESGLHYLILSGKQNCQNDSFESPRGMTIINEFGLYSLILRSQLPKARQFKRWVTSEVLPAIHKHGVFAVDTMDGVAICDSMGREQETILIKETGFAL